MPRTNRGRLVLPSGGPIRAKPVLACRRPCEVRITAPGGARARDWLIALSSAVAACGSSGAAQRCRRGHGRPDTGDHPGSPSHGAGDRRPDLQRDPRRRSCRSRSTTRPPAAPNAPIIKQINAQIANWPLIITEYRSSRGSCATRSTWDPAAGPKQGDPPYAWVGMNILVAFGPVTGEPTAPDADPPGSRRRTLIAPRRPARSGRSSSARSTPSRRRPRRRPRRAAPRLGRAGERRAVTVGPPATSRPLGRRGQRPRQADHRAPPAGRPAAVHPDRGGPRRVRGGRPGPDEPPRRARASSRSSASPTR